MAAARKAAMSLMAEMDSDDDTPPPAKPQEEAKPAGDVEAATAKLGAMSTKGAKRFPDGLHCCSLLVPLEELMGHADSWFVLPPPG